MQTTLMTKEEIRAYKKLYEEYHDKLHPNRKSGRELVKYLKERYPIEEIDNEEFKDVVKDNVIENECFRDKLPDNQLPDPVVYVWHKEGKDVYIGIDIVSGYYHIESDEDLFDELCAVQGLDEKDLENYFCVAQYIMALRKFDLLKD